MARIYLDTSAFNFLLKSLPWDDFLLLRDVFKLHEHEFVASPVLLWELLLAGEDKEPDRLLFAAQRLFSGRLFATPSEIVVRYMRHAYPNNEINYDPYSNHAIAETWERMRVDDASTLRWNREDLVLRTSLLRKVSRNLVSVLNYPAYSIADAEMHGLAKALKVFESCLVEDGFPVAVMEGFQLARSTMLVLFLLLVCRQDLFTRELVEFSDDVGLRNLDPVDALKTLTESYPYMLRCGPILEMAGVLACQGRPGGGASRGAFLDAYHAVYLPYVDLFFTTDDGLARTTDLGPHFAEKIQHVTWTPPG